MPLVLSPGSSQSSSLAMKLSPLRHALVLVLLAACSNAAHNGVTPPPPATCVFKNPIDDGADPWVIKSRAFYYYGQSRANGIYVYRSAALTAPKQSPVKVWSAPASGWNETNIWAPELH